MQQEGSSNAGKAAVWKRGLFSGSLPAPKESVQCSVLCQLCRNLKKPSEQVLLGIDLRLDGPLVWPCLSSVPVGEKGTAFTFHRYSSCSLPAGREESLTVKGLDHTSPSHLWKSCDCSCRRLCCKLGSSSAVYGLMELEKVTSI